MEEIEKLYNVLIDKKLYSKSLEEFEQQFSDPEYVDKVYNVVTDRKLYSKDKETFNNQYSSKKKIEDEPMDSPSEDGGSDLSEDQELQAGRKIDTLSIQIADLEKQIQTEAETPLSEEEEKLYPLGKPAEKTPAMIELESLTEQRDALIKPTVGFDNTNIEEQKKREGEIVSTDMELSKVNDLSQEFKDVKDLLNKNESFIVPKLNYLYRDQGFKFEEADILGQKIKVSARGENGFDDGPSIKINIGVFQDEPAKELLEFIEENKEASQALAKTVVGYEANNIKFRNDKEMNESLSSITKRQDRFNQGLQQYSANSLRLEKDFENRESMNQEQIDDYNSRVNLHEAAGVKLLEEGDNLDLQKAELNTAVGKYYDMQKEQGNFGLLMKYNLASGVSTPISEVANYALTAKLGLPGVVDLQKEMGDDKFKDEILRAAKLLEYASPLEEDLEGMSVDDLKEFYKKDSGKKSMLTPMSEFDVIQGKIKDRYIKDVKYGEEIDGVRQGGIITNIRDGWQKRLGGKSITEQYAATKQKGFFLGALSGVAESIPSLFAGPGRLASLFMLTSGKLDEQMSNNPDFANISENEKVLFKVPAALTVAALENYGIRNVFDKGGFVANVLTKVLNKMPKGGSARTFKEFLDQEVKNSATKGALVLGGATLAEAETGAFQEFSDIGFKEIYNLIKGKELFDTPESFAELLGQVAYASAQEAVGGFVLGTIPAVSAAVSENKFANLTEQQIQIFREIKNNPKISQSALTNLIKMEINGGEITTEQGKQIKADYELAIGLANELPGGIDNPNFAEAMDLKIRKKILEDRTAPPIDQNLGSVKQDNLEIQQINEKLSKINEPTTDTQVKGATQQESKDITEVVEEAESAAPVQETKESATDTFFGKKKTENVEEVSENLIINTNEQPDNLEPDQTTRRSLVKRIAKTGAKAIQKLFPETKIILHESTTEFERFAPAGNRGFYDTNENVIHVDLNKALATTVPHEIFHATLLSKIKTDAEAAKLAENMMRSIRKALPKNSAIARRIDEFAAKYDDQPDLQNEERLAELMGIMAADYTMLTKPQKNKVIKFLQELANKIGLNINISEFTQQDSDVVDLFNTLAGKISTGETITETDVQIIEEQSGLDKEQEQGEGGQVGTLTFPPTGREQRAPSVKTDTRSFSSLITDKSVKDFKNQKIITNMYDFTSAGPTEIAPGIVLNLYGGKSYVPLMMEKQGLNIGDFSNLAAFNTDVNAETFKRNVEQGDVSLFAPHVGTLEKSWQFQQNIFEQLTYAALDNNILTNEELITLFNSALTNIDGKKALNVFNKKSNLNIKDFNSFKDNPKKLVELLDIKNNYSPELRKLFNDRYSGNAKYKDALKVNNKIDFVKKFQDPLNVGSNSFDIISLIKFDNRDLQITKPNVGDVDYHPSFAYTIKANIEGIYQPDLFYQSSEVTDTYTKYNIASTTVSVKEEVGEDSFKKSNVASSSGSIPKVAQINKITPREQREKTIQEVAQFYNVDTAGFANPMVDEFQFRKAAEPLGYGVARARSGSLYVTKNNKFINPYEIDTNQLTGRGQRSDDFYVDIASQLRDRKVREELIVDTLRRQYKLSETKIKDILDIQSLTLGGVPDSFKKIGDAAGTKLFLQLETFILKQRKANKKKPLSKTAEADSVINYLMERPQFKGLAETYKVKGETKTKKGLSTVQAQMLSDLTSILEARPSQTVTAQIVKARQSLRDKKKSATTVKSQQQILINLLRRNLPKSLFTKSEVIDIVRKIQDLSTADLKGNNLENIVDEIEGIVTNLNNKNVLNRIKRLLNGKYEVVVSGKPKGVKIDVDTKKRLKTIASLLVTSTDVEVIEKTQDKLRDELKSLLESNNDTENQELTPETLMRIADITTALNYNEAMLQDPTDISRLENLTRAYAQLENIVVRGRDIQAGILQEKHKQYMQNLSILIKETTNQELNPDDKDFKTEVEKISETREGIANKEKVSKNVIVKVKRLMRNFSNVIGFGAAQDLTGLIDQLAEFPGVVFGGQLQEIVTAKVNESTRQYKNRMLEFSQLLEENLIKYYGKNYRFTLRNLNQTDNIFYKNPQEVESAQAKYDNNRNDENKNNLRDVLAKNEIILSQEQMGYMVFQYEDPALHPTFKNMYGEQYQRVMREMNEKLDDRVRAFGEWQVNEFYPIMHQRFNETYKRIYYTDMPYNKYYAGPIRREGEKTEEFHLLQGASKYNATVGSNYTKLRIKSKDKIKNSTLVDAMMEYTQDMEYFDAYAENLQTISRLFTNKDAKIIIESIHGEKFYKLIDNMINNIAMAGKSQLNLFGTQILNFFNNVFQVSRLMLSPAIAIKQLTSIPTFALEPEVGPANWIKYAVKNKTQQLKVYREVLENSVYLKDRAATSILRNIETYSPERFQSFIPKTTQNFAIDILMGMIKVADRSAILMGGLPNYSFYKAKFQKENPNATEQQAIDYAIRKFEKDVKSTQQSYDLQDRDVHQNRDPFSRGLNMFLTTPKQYLRREITGYRQMIRAAKRFAKGDKNKNAPNVVQAFSQLAFYHAFMPVLFAYTSLGLPGLARDPRDDDDDSLMRAAFIGNMNGLFLWGKVFTQFADAYQDKPWWRQTNSLPFFETATDFMVIVNALGKAYRSGKQSDYDKANKEMFDFINRNGLPYSIIERWVNNLQKVINGETDGAGEDVLRIFNFSEYAISGPQKKAKKLKFGSSGKKSKGLDFDFDTSLDLDLKTDFDID
tara:strand:- start:2251 stop:10428 length:8178 start_codon:yes stop_codon:yes gene_type:complete